MKTFVQDSRLLSVLFMMLLMNVGLIGIGNIRNKSYERHAEILSGECSRVL